MTARAGERVRRRSDAASRTRGDRATSLKSRPRGASAAAKKAGATRDGRVDPRIAERKSEVAREAGRRRVVVATSVLSVPALVASVFVILHSSLFAIGAVKVSGAHETSPTAIVAAAGLAKHPPLIDVNPIAVATRVEALPWIMMATVARHWPRSVSISVTERVPVAEAGVARHRWELFDHQGRALAYRSVHTAGLVRIEREPSSVGPGSIATGATQDEIALVDVLPVSLVSEVSSVGYSQRDGIITHLRDGILVIFGSPVSLVDKVVALNTLIASHVSFAGVSEIDLRVPSSPVLSPAGSSGTGLTGGAHSKAAVPGKDTNPGSSTAGARG